MNIFISAKKKTSRTGKTRHVGRRLPAQPLEGGQLPSHQPAALAPRVARACGKKTKTTTGLAGAIGWPWVKS